MFISFIKIFLPKSEGLSQKSSMLNMNLLLRHRKEETIQAFVGALGNAREPSLAAWIAWSGVFQKTLMIRQKEFCFVMNRL